MTPNIWMKLRKAVQKLASSIYMIANIWICELSQIPTGIFYFYPDVWHHICLVKEPREGLTADLEDCNKYKYLSTVNHRTCQQDMQTGRDTDKDTKPTLQVSLGHGFVLPRRCTVIVFQPQQIHNKQQEWWLHAPAVTAKEK